MLFWLLRRFLTGYTVFLWRYRQMFVRRHYQLGLDTLGSIPFQNRRHPGFIYLFFCIDLKKAESIIQEDRFVDTTFEGFFLYFFKEAAWRVRGRNHNDKGIRLGTKYRCQEIYQLLSFKLSEQDTIVRNTTGQPWSIQFLSRRKQTKGNTRRRLFSRPRWFILRLLNQRFYPFSQTWAFVDKVNTMYGNQYHAKYSKNNNKKWYVPLKRQQLS